MSTLEVGALAPHPRQTAAHVAAEALFEAVLSGAIQPGSPLRLQQIADQLGMSVMPVREAVRILESLGLVELQPHRGAWLRPLSRDDLLDTYFTRVNLELLAVREAARRFTPEIAEVARRELDKQQWLKQRGDQVAARAAHEQFHFTLYEAAGSKWLTRSILPAWRNAERYRVMAMRMRDPLDERRHREHLELLQALVDGDENAAARCLLTHLETSIRTGLEAVAAFENGGTAEPIDTDELREVLRLRGIPSLDDETAAARPDERH